MSDLIYPEQKINNKFRNLYFLDTMTQSLIEQTNDMTSEDIYVHVFVAQCLLNTCYLETVRNSI